jgi:hypothetical protein
MTQPQPMQPQRRVIPPGDAEERLNAFAMTVEMIHRIISVGDSARRRVMLPVYPATYPGTVMWAETLAEWRRQLRKRSREYDIGRSRGYETVFSAERQVAFTVVAGDSLTGVDGARAPRLTRPKGVVTKERVDRNREAATGLVQLALIPEEGEKKPPADELCDTWFLIVYAAKGEVRIELSLPVELDGDSIVSEYYERILLPPVPISGAITPMTPEDEEDDDGNGGSPLVSR